MLTCQKEKFSLPEDVSYLNCAYMGPLPKVAEHAGIQGLRDKMRPDLTPASAFFDPLVPLQKKFAQLIHCDDFERIAFIPSVSYGIANVTKNLRGKPGQNVVLLEEQFPSNYYSWRRLADEQRVELRIIQPPFTTKDRGAVWNQRILERIDQNTIAVSLPQVHWADGTLFHLSKIGERCREVGAKFIIDGSQSVGAFPFDVNEIQPDALITVGYKWLLGAYGFGLAYYGPTLDDGVPIEENWINRLDSHDFQKLVNYQSAYRPKAHRYSVGEQSNFIAVPILSANLDLILDWGVSNIQEYCRRLSQPYIDRLVSMGFWVEKQDARSAHLVGIRLPDGMDMEAVKQKMKAHNISISYRGNAVRISTNVYNDTTDFDRLIAVLESLS